MSGAMSPASSFFNMSLPTQLTFLTASAGYDPSASAYTSGGWQYQPAMTPQLLADALAESQATQSAGLAALSSQGASDLALEGGYFNDWATAQNDFMSSVATSLNTEANKSGSGGSGIFGQIVGAIGAVGALLAL